MLRVDRVTKRYRLGQLGRREMTAVEDVSFELARGEVVSLIGESGSGKTTIGRMILRLTSVTEGSITFDGADISAAKGAELKAYYRRVQGVFQDPFSSCNPIFKVGRLFETLRGSFFADLARADWDARVAGALDSVGLDAGQALGKYPHQLSGGQIQRLLIARALLLDIELLVADEIISMLDASTRIDVLNLLADLKQRGLGVLFITHDLSLGNYISERTIILRRGAIVEMGATHRVFGEPVHPYTRSLLASVPQLHRTWAEIDRDIEARARATGACVYHATERDPVAEGVPRLVPVSDDHLVACFGVGTSLGCPDAEVVVPGAA